MSKTNLEFKQTDHSGALIQYSCSKQWFHEQQYEGRLQCIYAFLTIHTTPLTEQRFWILSNVRDIHQFLFFGHWIRSAPLDSVYFHCYHFLITTSLSYSLEFSPSSVARSEKYLYHRTIRPSAYIEQSPLIFQCSQKCFMLLLSILLLHSKDLQK